MRDYSYGLYRLVRAVVSVTCLVNGFGLMVLAGELPYTVDKDPIMLAAFGLMAAGLVFYFNSWDKLSSLDENPDA